MRKYSIFKLKFCLYMDHIPKNNVAVTSFLIYGNQSKFILIEKYQAHVVPKQTNEAFLMINLSLIALLHIFRVI